MLIDVIMQSMQLYENCQ